MTRQNKKAWLQTATGKAFWPLEPSAYDVYIEDIAMSLSKLCRFNGHTTRFYSVAEHCVHISNLAPWGSQLWGLLHDASEAYICDIPRPIKPHLTNYYEIEAKIMHEVCERFGLAYEMPGVIKELDNAMLKTEQDQIMCPPPRPWVYTGASPVEGLVLPCWSPEIAKQKFLERFTELT